MTSGDQTELSSGRLSLLYQLTQMFNASLDLEEVLNIVIDEVITAIRAERGFVMLYEQSGSLDFKTARGIDQTTINDPQFEISRSVVEQVAKSGESLLTSDAQKDESLSKQTSVVNLKLRSILCAPLKIKDKILGVIYVDNRLTAGIFTEDDMHLMSSIASSASIAIENARLYQVAVEKGRMERELQVARRVQSSLIPQETPDIPGWEFAASWVPAREVAGDFYDFIPSTDGSIKMVIADVVDKGMAAALFMAFSRTTLRAILSKQVSPQDGIIEANQLICADSAFSMFLTLFYAQIDPKKNEITYVNAGHNPPLLYKAKENKLVKLTRTGMLIGVEADVSYEQASVSLEPGDFIAMFTDGITEAVNNKEQTFSEEKLEKLLLDNKKSSPEELKEKIISAVEKFVGSYPQSDDITLTIVKRT